MQTVAEIISDNLDGSQPPKSTTPNTESMPMHWVSHLFDRLHARYGTKWTRQHPNAKLEQLALTEWQSKLSGMIAEDIRMGLDNWDGDWPPSLPEFVRACKPPKLPTSSCHRRTKATPGPVVNKALAQKYIDEMHGMLR